MPIVKIQGFSCNLVGGVWETTDTPGTGSYGLLGAKTVDGIQYRTFVQAPGDGETTVYTVRQGSQFETGIGVIAAGAPPTISRALILESSNNNNAVNWGPETKDIILDLPAAAVASLQDQVDAAVVDLTSILVANVKQTIFTSSGTWTKDAKCLFAKVRMVGGGGSGGGASTTAASESAEGAGGGGGEYAEKIVAASALGSTETVTVGVGGTPAAGAAGGNGGTSSFGTHLSAEGGQGGGNGDDSPGNVGSQGGLGGSGGTGGGLHISGSRGSNGIVRSGVRGQVTAGGSSVLSGRATRSGSGDGQSGQHYGGGGSGASIGENTTQAAGGAGASGIVIVEEYLHS